MPSPEQPGPSGSFSGTVYGDLVGSPYMIDNTYNRYFDLGESRRAYSRGRVRTFFPGATEVSHGAAAVCRWLTAWRDEPTEANLRRCLLEQYRSHPRGGWTEPTRLLLTSGGDTPSATADWAAVTRAVPVAMFCGDDLFRALDLAEACVRATCSDEDTVRMAQAVTQAVFMAREGRDVAEVFTVLEMQYGLVLTRPEEDMRAELRGEVAEQLTMLGVPVEGAYRYRLLDTPVPPSSRLVTEAALRSVVRSDSWEDAVRRAVALGGPSNAVAGIAGGVAEALYGEVTPAVIGKLFTHVPMDVARQMDSLGSTGRRAVGPTPALSRQERDAVTIIGLGPGRTTYVVPEEREDLRTVIRTTFPSPEIILPSQMKGYLAQFREERKGTFAYGIRPEVRTLYVQDSRTLVSPSLYVAPGMPPLQERKRHLREFMALRAWCMDAQREMNALAGNPDAGQVHYGNAYHMWIGSRRIDFLLGDTLAGQVLLDDRGLLKVGLGEYRDVGVDSRFEGHREQAWASRSLFSVAQSVDPINHLDDIRDAIRGRLLDEGTGSGYLTGEDSRYLSEEERLDRTPVSNVDRLEQLAEGASRGLPPSSQVSASTPKGTEKAQGVSVIYSIGYGTRSGEAFVNTLGMLGVDTVIDVRDTTRSRKTPQFDEDTIWQTLGDAGIDYLSASEKLGTHAPEDQFREGIAAIEHFAEEGRCCAVVSAESDPLLSHRFGTVSRAFAADGMDVRHVLTNGEVAGHAEMEGRLIERLSAKGKLHTAVSGSWKEQLCEAYDIINAECRQRNVLRRPRIKRW